jgi:hypothetical protein
MPIPIFKAHLSDVYIQHHLELVVLVISPYLACNRPLLVLLFGTIDQLFKYIWTKKPRIMEVEAITSLAGTKATE